jgi:hypothetical protein
LGTDSWKQINNNELHNLYSVPDCDGKMTREVRIYSENLTERNHLEDLGLDKKKIKFWKELIAYFPFI